MLERWKGIGSQAQLASGMRRALARRARRNRPHPRPQPPDNSTSDDQTNRNQLGSRHGPAENFATPGIIAQEFKKEASHPVKHEECAHYLPVEFPALKQPGENEEIRDLDGRFKKLRRLEPLIQ